MILELNSKGTEFDIQVMPYNLLDKLTTIVIPSSDENSKLLDDFKINDIILQSLEQVECFIGPINKTAYVYKLKDNINQIQYYTFNNQIIKIDFQMLN